MNIPFWYQVAIHLIKPIYRWHIKKRSVHSPELANELIERFGPFQPVKNKQALWFHAVSVGETNAAQPLIEHYLQLGQPVLVTNTTKTGQARSKSLFLKEPYLELFQAVYLPADQQRLVQQFIQAYQPKLLCLMETELWPNLLDQAQQAGVKCLLLNARLSEKSAKGYGKVARLTQAMLQRLDYLVAQDVATQQRFVQLGMPAEHTQVAGNIKFDIAAPAHLLKQAQQIKQDWPLAGRKIMVIASTHAPEEKQLLTLLQPHLQAQPELSCIVVPRHPERFNEVFAVAEALNLTTHRRSLQETIQANTQVYLADSMGELWLWYALAQVCFVGGSLNEPGGGHNILEPIALKVPTVIGPRYFNFQAMVDAFVAAQGIRVGETAEQVVHHLLQLLTDNTQAQAMQQQANQVLQANQGSLQKHIELIDQFTAQA